jgi:hypothetical protein
MKPTTSVRCPHPPSRPFEPTGGATHSSAPTDLRRFAVGAQRPGHEREKDAAGTIDTHDDPFDWPHFAAITVSIAILGLGIWWVTPW